MVWRELSSSRKKLSNTEQSLPDSIEHKQSIATMLAKYFTVLSLLAATTAMASPTPQEQGVKQYAPGCLVSGEPGVYLLLKNGLTAQAEDKSWGEQKMFSLFKDDSKEEVFKLYKSQKGNGDDELKIDGDAIANVSKVVIEP
jgi:hypothetical protein